jgi:hypothetical protein
VGLKTSDFGSGQFSKISVQPCDLVGAIDLNSLMFKSISKFKPFLQQTAKN